VGERQHAQRIRQVERCVAVMLPIDGYRLGRCSLGRAILAELTVQIPHMPLSVGKLPRVVRDASKGGCTFVTQERLAYSPLHPILPGLLDEQLRILRHAFLRGRRTFEFSRPQVCTTL